jgi:integral membrane protein
MKPDLKTSVGRVRLVGMMEGVSFLLLMGVAMPLKYWAGIPAAVKWTGWVHGILFILYGMVVLMALLHGRLSFWKSVLAMVAALIPLGPFLLDRRLEQDERSERSKSQR